jgi:hypothetical protein
MVIGKEHIYYDGKIRFRNAISLTERGQGSREWTDREVASQEMT